MTKPRRNSRIVPFNIEQVVQDGDNARSDNNPAAIYGALHLTAELPEHGFKS